MRETAHCQVHNIQDSIFGKAITVFREPPRRLYKPNNENVPHLTETIAVTDNNIVEYLHRIQILTSNNIPLRG